MLVTGAGGGVGQSIIKSLAGTAYAVVGLDNEPLAVGLHAAAVARLGVRADDASFVPHTLEVCRSEGCALAFPGLDPELAVLSNDAERFQSAGTTVVVSRPEVIEICDDKRRTASFLSGHGFDAPTTVAFTDDVDDSWFPVILKPEKGGSRSVRTFLARDRRDFDAVRGLIDARNCVIQEYIDGDEYTCGTINLDGRCQGVIAMRRTLRAGDTYRAFVVRDRRIEEHVRAVADALGPTGACNFQLRSRAGRPVVFEINPRCSGTTYARALAGFNEPKMVADWLTQGIPPRFEIREITVLRYWKELVVPSDHIDRLARQGRLEGGSIPL